MSNNNQIYSIIDHNSKQFFSRGVRTVFSFAGNKMSGEEFEIKTENIGIEEAWQKSSDAPNQPYVKKANEINDETKAGYFAH